LGFDDAVLREKRFPTKEDLDKVSKEIPICIVHISGHFCVLNSKGLEVAKITAASKNPEGGVIRRMPGSQEPNGVLEELAAIPVFFPILSPTQPELAEYYLDKAQEMAVKFGYTTAQEGRAMTNHELMANYAEKGKFNIDIVSYVDYMFPQYMGSKWYGKEYRNRYRIGGLKITLDGSPQGRTAWRTVPYLMPPDGQKQGYKGYPAFADDKKVVNIYDSAFANNWQILTHANGDAAIDQMIRCLKPAAAKYGNDNQRSVLIHGQYVRMDQLDSLKKLDVIASLFPMHTFYWGDWHKQIIGDSLGNVISPIKSALNKGLHVTSHTDAPVAFPNLMMILHSTVNRVSRIGSIIGPEERLSPYEALQSITIWGAYQHFEEDQKGSLKVGKLADMVVLDKNPLKVDPMTLKDIQVLETIKEGKSVFKK
jgi:predicted amidohydrolase YtcJ